MAVNTIWNSTENQLVMEKINQEIPPEVQEEDKEINTRR